jgi:hypothetical protein
VTTGFFVFRTKTYRGKFTRGLRPARVSKYFIFYKQFDRKLSESGLLRLFFVIQGVSDGRVVAEMQQFCVPKPGFRHPAQG